MKTGELNYIDIIKAHEASHGLNPEYYHYEVRTGRGRYNKLVARDVLRFSNEPTQLSQGARAVAFIDRTTGAMYKAASWSQAAKTRIV